MPGKFSVVNNELTVEASVIVDGEAEQSLGTLGGWADSAQVFSITPGDLSPPENSTIGMDGVEVEFSQPDVITGVSLRFSSFSFSLKRLYDVATRIRDERKSTLWTLVISDTVKAEGQTYRRTRTLSEATLVNAGDSDIGKDSAGDVVFTWRAKKLSRTVPSYPDLTSEPSPVLDSTSALTEDYANIL